MRRRTFFASAFAAMPAASLDQTANSPQASWEQIGVLYFAAARVEAPSLADCENLRRRVFALASGFLRTPVVPEVTACRTLFENRQVLTATIARPGMVLSYSEVSGAAASDWRLELHGTRGCVAGDAHGFRPRAPNGIPAAPAWASRFARRLSQKIELASRTGGRTFAGGADAV